MKSLVIIVTGKVQGVFFRAAAKAKADELSLKGFVSNQPDGSVYIEAEAEEARLDQYIEWCRVGPPRAEVMDVIVNESVVKGFGGFEIRRS